MQENVLNLVTISSLIICMTGSIVEAKATSLIQLVQDTSNTASWLQDTSPLQPTGCRPPLQYSQLDAGHLSNTASWMQATPGIQSAGCRPPLQYSQLAASHLSKTVSWMQDTSPIQPAGCRTPLQYSRNMLGSGGEERRGSGGEKGEGVGEERRGSWGRRVEGAGGGEGRAWGRRGRGWGKAAGHLSNTANWLQDTSPIYCQLDEGHLWSTIATKPYRSFVPRPFISSRAWLAKFQ